jgi:hypothetical protein
LHKSPTSVSPNVSSICSTVRKEYRLLESKFELLLNLKAAKALGLTIPTSLLVRANEVVYHARVTSHEQPGATA